MDFNFNALFRVLIAFGVCVGLFIGFVVWLFAEPDNDFKTKHKLEPYSYEIVIKNNKADTTWLYKIK